MEETLKDTMSYDEFLEALSKIDGWFVEEDGAVRRGTLNAMLGRGSECPLLAVFVKDTGAVYTQTYSREVWHAADNWKSDENRAKIRQDILKACHLEPTDV